MGVDTKVVHEHQCRVEDGFYLNRHIRADTKSCSGHGAEDGLIEYWMEQTLPSST